MRKTVVKGFFFFLLLLKNSLERAGGRESNLSSRNGTEEAFVLCMKKEIGTRKGNV